MSNLNVHSFQWTGFPGGPGYTNFYCTALPALDEAAQRMRFWNFFNSLKGFLPASVSIVPATTYRVIDEVTGAFVDERGYGDSPSPIPGAGTPNYAAGVGGVITWRTKEPGPHGFMRGRTFLVPLSTNVMQDDGSFIDSALASLRDFANNVQDPLVPDFVVYRRPHKGQPGKAGLVTGATVPDSMAILKSRKP